jgi:hypothetical protein
MTEVRHGDVRLPLPPGWKDDTPDDRQQVVVVGPEDQGFRPNVVITRDPSSGETAEAFADRHLPMLRDALPDYELLAEGLVTLGPHAGFMREHGMTANGRRMRQLQFCVVVGETVFTMTFAHVATRFPAMQAAAEELFASVRLGDPR